MFRQSAKVASGATTVLIYHAWCIPVVAVQIFKKRAYNLVTSSVRQLAVTGAPSPP